MWIRIYRLIEMMSSWVDHNHFTHGGHDWLRRDQAASIGCGQKFESGFVQSWSVNFYSLLPPCFQLTNTSWPWTSLVECDDGSNFDLSVATFHNHLGWYKPSSPFTKELHNLVKRHDTELLLIPVLVSLNWGLPVLVDLSQQHSNIQSFNCTKRNSRQYIKRFLWSVQNQICLIYAAHMTSSNRLFVMALRFDAELYPISLKKVSLNEFQSWAR